MPKIDWNTIESLPTDNNPLYNHINRVLLPLRDDIRKVRVSCTHYEWNTDIPAYRYAHSSNYQSHLKHRHPKVYRDLRNNQQNTTSSDANSIISDNSSNIEPSISTTPFTIASQFIPITSNELKRLLIDFIVDNNLSFRVATSSSLTSIFKRINLNTPSITARQFTQEIDNYYIEQFNHFKRLLELYVTQNNGSFTLCTDSWTTKSQHALLGATIHYIDANQTLQSYALRLMDLKKRHTGEYMASLLYKTLEDFNISKSILTITRDNASNNDTMIDDIDAKLRYLSNNKWVGPNTGIRCLSHILNLIVQDILSAIKANTTKEELLAITQDAQDTQDTQDTQDAQDAQNTQNLQNSALNSSDKSTKM